MGERPKNFPLLDGIEHINIYSKGETYLGRSLTNMSNIPFEFNNRKYNSMEGFFFIVTGYFLNLPDFKRNSEIVKKLSSCSCYDAKKIGGKLINHKPIPDEKFDEFKAIYESALRCKIEQSPRILKELRESSLPFLHYYFYGEKDNAKVIENPKHNWMIEIIQKIRTELKNN